MLINKRMINFMKTMVERAFVDKAIIGTPAFSAGVLTFTDNPEVSCLFYPEGAADDFTDALPIAQTKTARLVLPHDELQYEVGSRVRITSQGGDPTPLPRPFFIQSQPIENRTHASYILESVILEVNTDVTIFSRGYDPATNSETWTKSVIADVAWRDNRGMTAIPGIREPDHDISVYVPLLDRAAVVDINIQDVIVRGEVTEDITALYTIVDLESDYDVLTVKSVTTVDFGPPVGYHVLVGVS